MPKRLGQHFLHSHSALVAIADAATIDPSSRLIEIGPGKGALTDHLLRRKRELVAVELDQVLVHYLTEKFRSYATFSVIHADVLDVDLLQWGSPVSVVGNLPYYITSPIVEKVLRLGPSLRNAVFLVQLEVAQRMAAEPGSRDYGYFSVLVQALAEPKILLKVPANSFRPPPRVDSAVIQFRPRDLVAPEAIDAFLKFASLAFQFKRKTLRNNLATAYPCEAIEALPEAAKRAEQLSFEQLQSVHQRILSFS